MHKKKKYVQVGVGGRARFFMRLLQKNMPILAN